MRLLRLPLFLLAVALVGCTSGEEAPQPAETESAAISGTEPASAVTVSKGKSVDYGQTSDDAPDIVPAPEAAPAPPVRPPSSAGEVVDRPDHVAFVEEFLRRQSVNDVAALAALYADRVRFFDLGVVGRRAVAEDKAAFFERWPNRYYALASPVRASGGSSPTLRFEYEFAVSRPGDTSDREGRAWTEITLAPVGDGYAIASERGGTY